MKKVLAMLLAAMMLLSCTSALAFDPISDSQLNDPVSLTPAGENDDSELKVDDRYISRHKEENGKTSSGDVITELWMQVSADGQIDVTVPLVLVFSTNVDGGKATAAENYTIHNNNQRNSIAVDKITVADENKGSNITFVSYQDFKNLDKNARDYYSVVMNPVVADDTKVSDNQGDNENSTMLKMNSQVHDEKMNTSSNGTKYYDLFAAIQADKYTEEDETNKALMTLGQGGVINLKPTMQTTPLTFVTKGAESKDSGEEMQQYGVKLLTVTYTVGLQYTDGVGEAIRTEHTGEGKEDNLYEDVSGDYLSNSNNGEEPTP